MMIGFGTKDTTLFPKCNLRDWSPQQPTRQAGEETEPICKIKGVSVANHRSSCDSGRLKRINQRLVTESVGFRELISNSRTWFATAVRARPALPLGGRFSISRRFSGPFGTPTPIRRVLGSLTESASPNPNLGVRAKFTLS